MPRSAAAEGPSSSYHRSDPECRRTVIVHPESGDGCPPLRGITLAVRGPEDNRTLLGAALLRGKKGDSALRPEGEQSIDPLGGRRRWSGGPVDGGIEDLFEVPFDARGDERQDQAKRFALVVAERVDSTPRQEDRVAGAGLDPIVLDPEATSALQDVQELVLALVDVRRVSPPCGTRPSIAKNAPPDCSPETRNVSMSPGPPYAGPVPDFV